MKKPSWMLGRPFYLTKRIKKKSGRKVRITDKYGDYFYTDYTLLKRR